MILDGRVLSCNVKTHCMVHPMHDPHLYSLIPVLDSAPTVSGVWYNVTLLYCIMHVLLLLFVLKYIFSQAHSV